MPVSKRASFCLQRVHSKPLYCVHCCALLTGIVILYAAHCSSAFSAFIVECIVLPSKGSCLLWTEMYILRYNKMKPLFKEVIVAHYQSHISKNSNNWEVWMKKMGIEKCVSALEMCSFQNLWMKYQSKPFLFDMHYEISQFDKNGFVWAQSKTPSFFSWFIFFCLTSIPNIKFCTFSLLQRLSSCGSDKPQVKIWPKNWATANYFSCQLLAYRESLNWV